MKGKDIAANLRENAHRWTRYAYYSTMEGIPSYCVIGLKLMEMGVKVEGWNPNAQSEVIPIVIGRVGITLDDEDVVSLGTLQRINDNSHSAEQVATQLEGLSYREVDFPLEKLAEAFKAKGGDNLQ